MHVDTTRARHAPQRWSQRPTALQMACAGADTDKMLAPGDIANMVWDVVNKPDNVYVEEVMIKDMFRKV